MNLAGKEKPAIIVARQRKENGMAPMTVFHASSSQVDQLEIRTGRYTKDFGRRFCCTILREEV